MSDIAVRVASRMKKRHAAKVYFADMYYEGTPVEKEVPDQLWDPNDPAKSFADMARYVDEQASGQPTDSEFGDVTTFTNVIQHGSDHVGIGDYGAGAQGESPSVWVFGPTAAETIGKITKAIEAWNEETVPELADAGLEEIVQYALGGKTARVREFARQAQYGLNWRMVANDPEYHDTGYSLMDGGMVMKADFEISEPMTISSMTLGDVTIEPGKHFVTVEARYSYVDAWIDDQHQIIAQSRLAPEDMNMRPRLIRSIQEDADRIISSSQGGKTAIRVRAAQPGDVECPQCGRDRSPSEKCWWCEDPAMTKDVGKIQKWTIMYYLEHSEKNKDIQDFEEFYGSLKDAQEHADAIMVYKYNADRGTGWDTGGEFSDVWNENHNYGDAEVYSRGYGEPDGEGYDFAVAYVGEPGWGQ